MLDRRNDRASGGLRLAADFGRVACPQDGDVDIEQCFACGYLDDMDDPDRPRVVVCRWRGSMPHGPVDHFDRHWRPSA
jgi:hypothetical protein